MLKFTFLSLFTGLLLTFSIHAQNVPVPQTSLPVIMKTSASWCSLCGGYGWNFFQQLLDDHQHQAVVFAGHISGDFNSVAATQIGANFGVFGHPTFLLNGINKGVNAGNVNAKRAEIATDIQNFLSVPPSVQLGIDATFSGDQLSVNYSLKAFNNLSGDYHLAFYLTEKEKVGQQTPIGSQAVHKNLFRHELNGNTFGPVIFSGNTPAGTIYDGSFTVALDNYSPANVEIIGIIWKATGNSFQIANANIDKTVQQITGVSMPEIQQADLRVFPTVFSDEATVELMTTRMMDKAEIYISDINGKKLSDIYSGHMPAGKHVFHINQTDINVPGLHFVVFRSRNLLKTARLILK